MIMTISHELKIAVVQFGGADDPELQNIAAEITKQGTHWYFFDEAADKDFEIEALLPHYDTIMECIDAHNFKEIK